MGAFFGLGGGGGGGGGGGVSGLVGGLMSLSAVNKVLNNPW